MAKTETAVLAGGCFWCTEAVFERLKGVESVMSGYAGGTKKDPTYEEVSSGSTGHAESLRITFDPEAISFKDLLTVFFATHDPTTLNRQGADVGTQYRSAIFYTSDKQREEAEKFIHELDASDPHDASLDKARDKPIVTEVKPLEAFYEAEEYHRDYYKRNTNAPYCQVVISPKLKKLNERFHELLKAGEE